MKQPNINVNQVNNNKENKDNKNNIISIINQKNDKKQSPKNDELKSEIYSKLNKFMEENEIQDIFLEKKDEIYEELTKLEKKELTSEFLNISKDYKNKYLKIQNLELNIDKNLITDIIEKENSKEIFKNKIIEEINNINKDKKKYEIEYLTILLVGRTKIGKTSLIKYILKLKENDIKNINQDEYFVEYKSIKVCHLKLIEFKGIGYDKNNNPKVIENQTIDFIQERNKYNNYNNFIHCIWYCVSGTRLEELEYNVLKSLKGVYKDNEIPIIIVHTQTIDEELAGEMEEYIKGLDLNIDFVKVLAKDTQLENNAGIKPAYGEKELLNLTLTKCTEALGGNMINIMINKISNDIKEKMIKENESNENILNNDIIDNFITDYKKVLDNQSFLDYFINILGKKLKMFYDKEITNSSLNSLIQSDIIRNIKDFITNYKEKTKEIIKPIIDKKANDFIDYQASKEKERRKNIKNENKRDLKGFKKTNKIFLKKNFYYISQKYLINYIIQNFCRNYFIEFRNILDSFIKDLLELNNDMYIKQLLINCFTMKLKNFANKNKIHANIKVENTKIIENDLPYKNQVNDEILKRDSINTNSFNLNINDNELDKEEENEQEIINSNKSNEIWFPIIRKNYKYLKRELIDSLNQFLQKIEYQDCYFNLKTYDRVFNKLKEYVKKDLENYFNSEKKNFIMNLDREYNQNILKSDTIPINQILTNENTLSLYNDKIKNEFDKIKNNSDFAKIGHLSIIVIGKSGVGKSTLINALLKLEGDKKSKETTGKIGTEKDKAYTNEKVPFLRIIDTRGIELTKKYGPKIILEKTKEIIDKQNIKKNIPDNEYNPKENGYSDYVHCIWYCVSNNGIDPQEIEIIKQLNFGKDVLPLIVVFTNAKNTELVNNVKSIIQKEFGDMPFIKVLAKPIKGVLSSFGIDNLIIKTLDICKNAVKSEMFYTIKEIVSDNIKNVYNEKNNEIKYNVNKDMVSKYIKEYNKVIGENDNFIKYIFDLLETIFIGYLKKNKEEKKLNPQSKEDLINTRTITDSINEYISFYKNNAINFVNSISSEKALKYLDEQAKKEIAENKLNINIENKNNKKDFIKIIETFLNNNFYFISQKYIIYRLITDVSESFSEGLESQINQIVIQILKDSDADNWSKEIFYQKFDDLKETINYFFQRGGYIGYNSIKNIENKDNSNIIFNNRLSEIKDYDCPKGPYPNLE